MKFSNLAISAFLALPVFADDVPAGALKLRVKRSEVDLSDANKLKRRDGGTEFGNSIEDKLNNKSFSTQLKFKSVLLPKMLNFFLILAPLILGFPPNSRYTGNNRAPTSFFDESKSSTWNGNNTDFHITYGIGQVNGKWGTDHLAIGGATIENLSIGLAESSDSAQGIVGIGRPQAEITNKDGTNYANLPLKLYQDGHVNSPAFSLYLNDLKSQSGTILLALLTTPSTRESLFLWTYLILSTGITLNSIRAQGLATQNILDKPMTAILDSGTTLSYIPNSALINLHNNLNANPSFTINQRYYCDCNITDYLQFNFGDQSLKVPNYQFLWPIEQFVNPYVAGIAFPHNSCLVGFEATPNGADYILLGDNVLRSAYIVYDPSNSKIALAQADFSGSKSNIELIKTIFLLNKEHVV